VKTSDQVEAAEQEIRNLQQEVDYTVREYPVEVLVMKHLSGIEDEQNEIFVPDYQRDLIWDERRQSKFIESLLMGLPVPYLFVADVGNENSDLAGRLEIVDGTQRIRTLARFTRDELVLEKLQKLTSLNGFRFSDLPPSRQRRFNRITLRMIELTEKAQEETRRDMFDRINTGSVKLNDMESRRGRMPGPFIDLIKEMASGEQLKRLAPVSKAAEKRYEREELVARFFAYRYGYDRFGQPKVGKVVSDFVDKYVRELNSVMRGEGANGPTEQRLKNEWSSMLAFVEVRFVDGFAKGPKVKSTPRVRFEAIAVGTALALAKNANPPGATTVQQWINDKEFRSLTTTDAANNRNRVISRIEFVRNKLLGQ